MASCSTDLGVGIDEDRAFEPMRKAPADAIRRSYVGVVPARVMGVLSWTSAYMLSDDE
jgi:hypothetical protein